jgi:single-stranded-DNA-specific exonuclease
LDLVSIGTIADQVPLIGTDRSFVKWGLIELNETKRPGLISLFKEAGLMMGDIGTYEVGYIIAPRINAMGRIEHAIDSLRLLCTKSKERSLKLANTLGTINQRRQKIVDEVVAHAKKTLEKDDSKKVLILSDKNYHEGVIGLAASKLVEEFYKPAIVISKGKKISKASARSIYGFNIIKAIRKLDNLLENGGGHPMAAGFSILTKNLNKFETEFQKLSSKLLTKDILSKKIKIDMALHFKDMSIDLIDKISILEPFGMGNFNPVFLTRNVLVKDAKIVGKDKKHLRLLLEKDQVVVEAIAFNKADYYFDLEKNKTIDVAYYLEKNIWDGREKIQLKIKDIIFSNRH